MKPKGVSSTTNTVTINTTELWTHGTGSELPPPKPNPISYRYMT